jgi:hypothetical protein
MMSCASTAGRKWPPLKALLAEHPEYTQDYDYIWLPDDDPR